MKITRCKDQTSESLNDFYLEISNSEATSKLGKTMYDIKQRLDSIGVNAAVLMLAASVAVLFLVLKKSEISKTAEA